MSVEIAAVFGLFSFSFMNYIIGDKFQQFLEQIPNSKENEFKKNIYKSVMASFYMLSIIVINFNLWFINSILKANNTTGYYNSPLNILEPILTGMLYINITIAVLILGTALMYGFLTAAKWGKKATGSEHNAC